jgi:hypothetical protein
MPVWKRIHMQPSQSRVAARTRAFGQDYATVDDEIGRLKSLVDLGGCIPYPDSRLPADAK